MLGHSQTSNFTSAEPNRELRQRRFQVTHINRSGFFAFLSKIFGQIVSGKAKALSNKNLVESRHIKREKVSLLVNVRCSKTSLLKFPKANEQEQHVTSLCKAASALKQNRKGAAVRRLSDICSFQIVKALTR